MSALTSLFEPEELFGEFWHGLVGDIGNERRYAQAAVELKDMRKRLEIMFRALGGEAGIEIKAISPEAVNYRQNFLAEIGHASNSIRQAKFDGDQLFLPETIEIMPEKNLNRQIYIWLAAWAATVGEDTRDASDDPLENDIMQLRFF